MSVVKIFAFLELEKNEHFSKASGFMFSVYNKGTTH
jgi:hypothetical protein